VTAQSTDQWRALIERAASTRPLRWKRTAAIRWPCASTRLERKRPPNRHARSLHQDRRSRLKAGRVRDSIRRRTTKWFHSPIAHSGKLASGNALQTPEGQTSLALVLYRPTQSIVAASLDDKLGLWITVLVGGVAPTEMFRGTPAGATERRPCSMGSRRSRVTTPNTHRRSARAGHCAGLFHHSKRIQQVLGFSKITTNQAQVTTLAALAGVPNAADQVPARPSLLPSASQTNHPTKIFRCWARVPAIRDSRVGWSSCRSTTSVAAFGGKADIVLRSGHVR
jgi:hypothetical protein